MKRPNKEEIARRNLAFRKAPKPRKRVIIARDVLAQLVAGRITAKAGTYLSSTGLDELYQEWDKASLQLQSVLLEEKSCTACALGSMFTCGVQIANKLNLGQASSIQQHGTLLGHDAYNYLLRFFDLEQLLLIESAFEQKDMQDEHRTYAPDKVMGKGNVDQFYIDMAIIFAHEVDHPFDRLRLIMENIIVNRGTFDPAQAPAKQWITVGFVR